MIKDTTKSFLIAHRQAEEKLCLFVSPLRMGTPIRNGETKKENRAIDVSIELADTSLRKVKPETDR